MIRRNWKFKLGASDMNIGGGFLLDISPMMDCSNIGSFNNSTNNPSLYFKNGSYNIFINFPSHKWKKIIKETYHGNLAHVLNVTSPDEKRRNFCLKLPPSIPPLTSNIAKPQLLEPLRLHPTSFAETRTFA